MNPRKPDKFERMVLAAMKKQDTPSSTCIWLNGPDVAKLLRNEHQAVLRLVRRLCDEHSHSTLVRDCLIDHLTRRAK